VYLDPEEIQALEGLYGVPREIELEEEFNLDGFYLLRWSMESGRAHDITLFIEKDGRYAVIQKPSYPRNAFRAPSGGVRRGEPIEAGAKREAWEETGLEVALTRYLLRVRALFVCDGEVERWVSHVFAARAVGGRLDPKDRREISVARLVTFDELRGPIRRALLDSGLGGLRYRALLTDAALDLLSRE